MPINSVIHTNEQSIDRVLNAGLPVLLVFWKKNSPVSQQLDPALDAIAQAYAGRALVAKVDVVDEPALAARYAVSSAPSIAFFKDGGLEGRAIGAVEKSGLERWVRYLLEGDAKPSLPSGPSEPLAGAPTPGPTYTNGSPGHGNGQPRPQGDGKPVILSDASFDRIINQEKPVLVDFWAPWCGPCRMVAPAVEQLAEEFAGQAIVGKLNVDENPATAQRYGIMSIPALYIFKQGQVVDRLIGVQPATVLRQRLQAQL